ncbi:hypothetical protein LQE92_06060 [Lacrimispora sp. NSJ-141]|uniref:Uncharacterized protein n=1 Tax=Lientehia hominis TaxID=2897778 RepID=A0AAP2W9Q5_9FIRM|nr:DUF6637 family protein [Lientehia hominis]MCD2492192.1 hypothetical protein [Lientehia hominis]
MYVNRTKKNPYTKQTIFDILSVVSGLAVIGLGVFVFLNPEEYAQMFPVIFLLAAVFQILCAIPRLAGGYGKKSGKRKAVGICLCAAAGILLIFAVVSAICLWR